MQYNDSFKDMYISKYSESENYWYTQGAIGDMKTKQIIKEHSIFFIKKKT